MPNTAAEEEEENPTEDGRGRSARPEEAGASTGGEGQSSDVLPPMANPTSRARTSYSMAFILLAHDQKEITAEHKSRMEQMRSNLPSQWSQATRGRATMITSHPIAYLVMPASALKDSRDDLQTIARRFYAANPDDFDFISIYTTFQPGFADYSFHWEIQSRVGGIGLPVDKPGQNRFVPYGSKGHLLGINWIGNGAFSRTEFDPIFAGSANLLLHETGHHWCCFVGDEFKGQSTGKLEIRTGPHFYAGLSSLLPGGEAMNSGYFVDSGDGTFRSSVASGGLYGFNDFSLYFMGLLPEADYDKKFSVYKKDPKASKWYPYREVSVRDIIAIEGPREEH